MRSSRTTGGFSAVELIVAIAILAVVLPGLLVGLWDLERGAAQARMRFLAEELAQDQLDEIVSKAFEDPNLPGGSFGTEELPRSVYDDVDDFSGLTQSPPTDALGNAIAGASGFTRSVTVQNVSDTNPNTVVTDGSSNYKRVTVTLTWADGGSLVVRGLKARQVVLGPATTQLGFIYVGMSRSSVSAGRVVFSLYNATGTTVSLTGMQATWVGPVGYYGSVSINNTKVWKYQNVGGMRAGNGDFITFTQNTPFVVPAGATVQVVIQGFMPTQSCGGKGEDEGEGEGEGEDEGDDEGNVNMNPAVFVLELDAGAARYPYISVPAYEIDETY